MKTTILILIFIVCSTYQHSNAQEKTVEKRVIVDSKGNKDTTEAVIISKSEDITPRSNMLIINPLKFFLFYNLSYYRKIDNTLVIGGGFQLPTIKGVDGFGFNAEIRIHPSRRALRGFYIAPNISYNNLTTSGANSNANVFSIGALIGWQWFPGDEFAMGLGIGIDHYFLSNSKDAFNSYDGNVPAIRFDIGYAW
ncbi:MAG: hypothetical protein HYZ10_11035 [Ignavibacteriales bacterium]|nr:hypothetical protein [Ignavibacteriales bacterium]